MDHVLGNPKFLPLEKERKARQKSALPRLTKKKKTPDLTKRGNSNILAQGLLTVKAPIIGPSAMSSKIPYPGRVVGNTAKSGLLSL